MRSAVSLLYRWGFCKVAQMLSGMAALNGGLGATGLTNGTAGTMDALTQAYSGIQQYAAAALPTLYSQSLLQQQGAAGSQKEGRCAPRPSRHLPGRREGLPPPPPHPPAPGTWSLVPCMQRSPSWRSLVLQQLQHPALPMLLPLNPWPGNFRLPRRTHPPPKKKDRHGQETPVPHQHGPTPLQHAPGQRKEPTGPLWAWPRLAQSTPP